MGVNLEINNFEKDYMIYKIGCFEFLDKKTISYRKFKLIKIKDFWYNVSFLNNVIFEGILKDCLEFMEDNCNELYPIALPNYPKEISEVSKLLEMYKEFIIKRFTNSN